MQEGMNVEREQINMGGRRKRKKYSMQNKEGMERNKDN